MKFPSRATMAAFAHCGYKRANSFITEPKSRMPFRLKTHHVPSSSVHEPLETPRATRVKADGTVSVWGDNTYGQTNFASGLSNIIGVAAGDFHFVALRRDGTVLSWAKTPWASPIPRRVSTISASSQPGAIVRWPCVVMVRSQTGEILYFLKQPTLFRFPAASDLLLR